MRNSLVTEKKQNSLYWFVLLNIRRVSEMWEAFHAFPKSQSDQRFPSQFMSDCVQWSRTSSRQQQIYELCLWFVFISMGRSDDGLSTRKNTGRSLWTINMRTKEERSPLTTICEQEQKLSKQPQQLNSHSLYYSTRNHLTIGRHTAEHRKANRLIDIEMTIAVLPSVL